MGLNRVISSDPFELKRNHHVLAQGYDLAGSALRCTCATRTGPGTIT